MNWYKKGLCFSCTECGKCCSGPPGYIWVEQSEMQAIADSLNLPIQEFVSKYTRKVQDRYSLIEHKALNGIDNDCVFLKDGKCSIYSVRPKQCRTYPFWPENVKTKEAWTLTAQECEGIHDEATVVTSDKINEILHS
ncbi:MAG: YkgJ family cysteine cluster protein [Waddliaceae bacterium]